MTPAERQNLEYTYDRLLALYEAGDIRPGEMTELQRLDDILRPGWDDVVAAEEAQTSPTLQSREPTTREDVADWWADKIRRVSADTPWPLDDKSSYRMADRIAGLLELVPGPSAMMSIDQAGRDIGEGNYGAGAANAAFGLLDLLPGAQAKAGLKGVTEGMIDIPDHPITRDYFARQLRAAQASQGPIGRSVSVYTPDEYTGMKMAMTPAGDAGYVVKPDGEVASVVKHAASPIKGFAGAVMRRSEPQGGYWLNAFDTALPGLYGREGFRPVSRIPFAEDIARSEWGDEAADAFMSANAKYSGGRPDLVFMVRNPMKPGPVQQGQGGLLTDDYDLAAQELEQELRRLGYR